MTGLFLQMPNVQASVIWPASGFAMGAIYVFGYRYLPSIFFATILASLYFYDVIDIKALTIASCIAVGTTMQASLGTFLFKKYLSPQTTLESIKDIGKLMFLGGPIACCISASVATFTLYCANLLKLELLASHFYSWWLGDVFGVLVFTPLIILLFSKAETNVSLNRKLLVSLPTILAFSLLLFLFFHKKNDLEHRALQDYKIETSRIAEDLKEDLYADLSVLRSIRSFFNASDYVSAEDFTIFTSQPLQNSDGLLGVSWLPKVSGSERENFEKSIQNQGYPDFSIQSRVGKGNLKTSQEKSVYFPLAYTEPYILNKKAHGFDVYGEDPIAKNARRETLNRARDYGTGMATKRFSIVQDEDNYGFIVYEPVYKNNATLTTKEERTRAHLGFINGIFVFPKLMAKHYQKAKEIKSDILLHDISVYEKPKLLFDSRTHNFKEGSQHSYNFENKVFNSKQIDVAERQWKVTIIKNDTLLSQRSTKDLWYLVNGGLIVNSLVIILLLVITARTAIIEKLVDIKTKDLQAANTELEEFAYRTSHDLRSPLVSSIGLLTATEEMLAAETNNKDIIKSLRLVKKSLTKLEILVRDILALTHLKGSEETLKDIDFEKLVTESLENFRYMENFDRLKIKTSYQSNQKAKAYRSRVRLIVENLITNAIKYQDLDKKESFIEISTYENADQLVFQIKDNGIRIPDEKQGQIFEMFTRFHPKQSYGSGLGLYMVKKSANIIEADIVFEDTKSGSCFKLIIPLKN